MVLGWMIPPPIRKITCCFCSTNGIFAQGLGLGGCKTSSKNWSFCRKIILKLLNKNASLGADIVHPNHLWELSHPTVPSLSAANLPCHFWAPLKGSRFPDTRQRSVFPSYMSHACPNKNQTAWGKTTHANFAWNNFRFGQENAQQKKNTHQFGAISW